MLHVTFKCLSLKLHHCTMFQTSSNYYGGIHLYLASYNVVSDQALNVNSVSSQCVRGKSFIA